MPREQFAHVDTWVFDLDNTLYPPSARLFSQIQDRMTAFVMRELDLDHQAATDLRQEYWRSHGTTLAGLMELHDLDPDPYLADVHDIDLTVLAPAPALNDAIAALPGRRIVYTNGSREHGRRVVHALGLGESFQAIYGFEDADYQPKPTEQAFATVFALENLKPESAAMFEDEARNLLVPHGLGMRTVLVGAPEAPDHVHHRTDDLAHFLGLLRQ